MEITKPHAALLATPGMGHLIPVLELAHRLVTHHGLDVTVFTVATDASTGHSKLPTPGLFNVVVFPPVDVDPCAPIFTQLKAMMRQSIPKLRSSMAAMRSRPAVLVVDLFGTESLVIADEFNMSKYVYLPNNAWFVALALYLPAMDKNHLARKGPVRTPGCKAVQFEDVVEPVQEPNSEMFNACVRLGEEILTADGVMVNTWEDLEPTTFGALKENKILREAINVPVHPIGPLIRSPRPSDSRCKVLDWLDMQPRESVLYISFGSGGRLSAKQITEMAMGLELSQQRFIWVVRPPMEDNTVDYLPGSRNGLHDDIPDYLPRGFLTRTQEVGLVVSFWAPQDEILAHQSVGGFLSHCGWNSSLESLVNGVPLIAWPLYAEQNMNAAFLTEELGVAVRSKALPSKEVVKREEVEKMVRRVMEEREGNVMRERVKELSRSAERALSKGGSSYKSLYQLTKDWENCAFNARRVLESCDEGELKSPLDCRG